MSNVRIEKIDGHLQKMLKDKEFRRLYEIERAKVALAQKIAEMRQEKHLNQKEIERFVSHCQHPAKTGHPPGYR